MIVGVDFDNTLVCYDAVIHARALRHGFISPDVPQRKNSVRNVLRDSGRNDDWTRLQGEVYGEAILEAEPYPNALDFLRACLIRAIPVHIVSFKTRQPALGRATDLHAAARSWLEKSGIHTELRLPRENVHLELSREQKAERIRALGITHFIDDLPEFLGSPLFPTGVKRILFDPNDEHDDRRFDYRASGWKDVRDYLLPS